MQDYDFEEWFKETYSKYGYDHKMNPQLYVDVHMAWRAAYRLGYQKAQREQTEDKTGMGINRSEEY